MIVVLIPLLKSPNGFVHGCKLVQKTVAPFFETHLGVIRTATFLRTFVSLPRFPRAQPTSSRDVRGGWRCPMCGLLGSSLQKMRQHAAECHGGKNLSFERVWKSNFGGPPVPRAESFSEALSTMFSPGRCVADTLLYLLMFLRQMYVLSDLGVEPSILWAFAMAWASSSHVAPYLRGNDVAWSLLPNLRALVVEGQFRGKRIAKTGSTFSLRTKAVYEGAAQCLLFMRRLSKEFQAHVMKSHGDHIPRNIRDAATYLFAVPLIFPSLPRTLLHEFQISDALSKLAGWVRSQVRQSYSWPSDESLCSQYDALIGQWQTIARETESFRDANGLFLWNQFWQESHTKAMFAPAGTEAVRLLYNFSGMWGTSEAEAESVGSLLKYYGRTKTLSFDRIVERVKLRHANIDGLPRCDALVLRIWAAYFGESCNFRFKTKKLQSRRRRFALGSGSKTLHRVVAKELLRGPMAAKARKKEGDRPSGAWFDTEDAVRAHCATVPDMAHRIVRVDFPDGSKWVWAGKVASVERSRGKKGGAAGKKKQEEQLKGLAGVRPCRCRAFAGVKAAGQAREEHSRQGEAQQAGKEAEQAGEERRGEERRGEGKAPGRERGEPKERAPKKGSR
eukprot:Skav230713  [mRNA]  locus=scaffold715:157589:163818:- [translate_table: standard]